MLDSIAPTSSAFRDLYHHFGFLYKIRLLFSSLRGAQATYHHPFIIRKYQPTIFVAAMSDNWNIAEDQAFIPRMLDKLHHKYRFLVIDLTKVTTSVHLIEQLRLNIQEAISPHQSVKIVLQDQLIEIGESSTHRRGQRKKLRRKKRRPILSY